MPTKIVAAKLSGKVRYTNAHKQSANQRIGAIIRELGLDWKEYKQQASLRSAMRMVETPLSPYFNHQ